MSRDAAAQIQAWTGTRSSRHGTPKQGMDLAEICGRVCRSFFEGMGKLR